MKTLGAVVFLCVLLTGCGGGSSGGGNQPDDPTYSIGGTISGLDGTVVLQNGGADNLTRSTNGVFTFPAELDSGDTYAVTVLTQPAGQICSVSNGSGTVGSADITNIDVTCVDNPEGSFSVGGNVSGLDGNVTLQNNGGDGLNVNANGSFTFSTPIVTGNLYSVTVASQPAGQICTVVNGSGTIGDANVTNVAVTCVDDEEPVPSFTIGGNITGLTGSVVLQNNAGDDLTRTTNGAFTFAGEIDSGSTYAVTVLTQPAGQICTVTSGSGTVGSANVTNVAVDCADDTGGDIDNADLASLTLSAGSLDQIFQPNQLAYTSTQAFLVTELQITPTAAAPGATITVNGNAVTSGEASAPIALSEDDETTITIVVTAADGTTDKTYTIEVTREDGGAFAQRAYLKASNTGINDLFGWSIAVSGDGNTLAVGAPQETSTATGINGDESINTANNNGAVYVFTRSDEVWTQQAYVKASNTGPGDQFGISVALSGDGNLLAVGAHLEDSAANGVGGDQSSNGSPDSGAVYIFGRASGIWAQQSYIKASNTNANDWFGSSVSLSSDGNTLAVGAEREASSATGVNGDEIDNGAGNSGAAYVFVRSSGTWSQQAYVKASNTGANDRFGYSLALSADGNTLAVGAYQEDSSATGIGGIQTDEVPASNSGAAYVFTRSGTNWNQQAYVKASNTGAGDLFGTSIALSRDGNTLAVGAPGEGSNTTGINGDQFNNSAGSSGATYVYTRSVGEWTQQAYVKASNTGGNDRFGQHVALSGDGNLLVVGAYLEDSNAIGIDGDQANNLAIDSGAAYLYTRASGLWTQQTYVKASNADAGDYFGATTAVSDDGSAFAISAYREASSTTGVDGDEGNDDAALSGAVYIF